MDRAKSKLQSRLVALARLRFNCPMRNPIIVALDVATAEAALKLVEQLAPVCGGFKVGSELFTAAGPDIVRRIRGLGAPVFLDLKFHDIPNTVARAVAAAVQLDVQMLTVHTSGGMEMLKAAEKAAQESAWQLGHAPPLVLGVTILTSLDGDALSQIGLDPNVSRQVRRLANMANQAGLRGLVCSPREVAELRADAARQHATGHPRHPCAGCGRRRPETNTHSARGAGPGRELAGDWPADLRRREPARRGGADSQGDC